MTSAELIAALRAALATDEATARNAGGDRWTPQGHPADTVAVYDSHGDPVVYDESLPTPEQVAHIVRHDPARVLADIAAKRAILDLHEAVAEMDTDDPEPEFAYGRAVGLGEAVRALAAAYDITA